MTTSPEPSEALFDMPITNAPAPKKSPPQQAQPTPPAPLPRQNRQQLLAQLEREAARDLEAVEKGLLTEAQRKLNCRFRLVRAAGLQP